MDFLVRQYLHETWRKVAKCHGFSEYETPLLEDTELYLKKSGGELSSQLFRFEDQGGRDVTLRPEVTASLARLAGKHQRDFPKPMKWFEIGQCFRYEKPQKGRGREFFQFNADIIGENSVAADAELLALAIGTMLALGFEKEDFALRVSDRQAWVNFASARNVHGEKFAEFLQIIDKLERERKDVSDAKLMALGLSLEEVQDFIAHPENASENFAILLENLTARGLGNFVKLDLGIVRGLAYYTGMVFEIFDAKNSMRAVAGGGRYDELIGTLTDGKVKLAATGFAMGDYVIRNLIEETSHALMQMEVWLQRNRSSCDVFVCAENQENVADALRLVTELRLSHIAADHVITAAKLNKQLQKADQAGARFALIVGDDLKLRSLMSRTQEVLDKENYIHQIQKTLARPDGIMLA